MLTVDNNNVVDLSGSPPPPPCRKNTRTRHTSLADVDVIVVSESEDEGLKGAAARLVRHVLSNAQINLPAPDPIPGPSVAADPFENPIARVLEIVPDVSRDHLRLLLNQLHPTHGDAVVEESSGRRAIFAVLHTLFEDPNYPRTEKSAGKRKRVEDTEQGSEKYKVKIDYTSQHRRFTGGCYYFELALAQLLLDFPYIPKPHVRRTLFASNNLYVPAYFSLAGELLLDKLPYKKKSVPSRLSGKGKQQHDAAFDRERTWLVDHLAKQEKAGDVSKEDEDDEECEDGIECGCCFSKYAFDKMVQCPEAHLFCRSCCRSYAANQLGQHDPRLRCMDQSGCKELFPESELSRFLSEKLLTLYHRVKQQKEIAAAGLEGLEECPFCEYKVVIENPDEKLFRCESLDCGAVSCRTCKKLDHLPKSCKEMEEDKHLSVRHVIEEAMTKALTRNCPKCQKAFVKADGCNKMTCPNCGTLSCYICRKVITGYQHFNHPPPYTGVQDPSKCQLWDPTEQRHKNEVIEAAKKAVEDYKASHPGVSEDALKVDLLSPAHGLHVS